jgi:hypothetical protein
VEVAQDGVGEVLLGQGGHLHGERDQVLLERRAERRAVPATGDDGPRRAAEAVDVHGDAAAVDDGADDAEQVGDRQGDEGQPAKDMAAVNRRQPSPSPASSPTPSVKMVKPA